MATSMVTMKTNAALGLVLAGTSLLLLGTGTQNIRRRTAGLICAVVVFIIGTLTTAEHAFGLNFGIDELLFTEPGGAIGTTSPNRMGPIAAGSLAAISIALIALVTRKRVVVPYIGMLVCAISLIPALGYLYGAQTLFSNAHVTGIAWATAVALLSLGIGLNLACVEAGVMPVLLRDDAGGAMLRQLLPAAIVFPILLGFVRSLLDHRGIVSDTTGRALLVLSLIVVFSALLTISAARLSRSAAAETASVAKVRRLSAIVESSDEAIIGMTLDGTITSWNGGAERLYGYTATDAIGELMWMLIPSGHPNELAGILEQLSRGEQVKRYEAVRQRKDGTLVPVAVNISPIRDSNGRIVGASSIAHDISERKQAQQALLDSEHRYRSLFESMDEGFCVVEVIFDDNGKAVDYRFLETNPSFEKHSGLVNASGKTIREIVPKHEEHWFEIYGRIAKTGEPARFQASAEQPSRWFDVYAFRYGQAANRQVAILFSDITDRKRADERLRESEQRFRSLSELVPQMLWSADAKGEVTYVNERWAEYTGQTQAEAQGRGSFAVVHPDDLAMVKTSWQSAIEAETAHEIEVRIRHRDGGYRWFLARGVPVRNEEGRVERWFGACTDIDDLKRSQEALVRTEKLASVGRMAATVAHELNNPLEAVMNSIFLVARDPSLSASGREHIRIAEREIERAAHIARQTLGFYRESSVPKRICLPELIDGVVDLFSPKLRSRNMSIERRYAEVSPILAVEGEIRQIVSNFVANGIDASRPGATLHLRVSELSMNGQKSVRMTVADTGSGIAPAHLPRIFDAFFTTKEAFGTGLGLWVSKGIAEKHNARIRVRSRVGHGAVFTVYFPAHSGSEPCPAPVGSDSAAAL